MSVRVASAKRAKATVPMVANVDLTPLVLFVLCQLVLMVPILAIERALLGSL